MAYEQDQYNQAPAPDADPREIESWALLKAANRLDNAARNPDDEHEMREALRQNQMLWTILQSSVAEETSPLQAELRSNILQLSVFVDKRTFSILGDLDPTKVKVLVDINRNLALGLMGKSEDGQDNSEHRAVENVAPVQGLKAGGALV